jgi:hypothetical protein
MAEQDWLTPANAPDPTPYQNVYAAPSVAAPAYDLRPLTLGELLDRTFALYRSRFWLFAGIAAVSGVINLVANVVQVMLQHFYLRHNVSTTKSIVNGGVTLVMLAFFFLAYSVTQAATIHALSEVYLGKIATIGTSLRATAGRWYVYAAIALWQWWSMIWVPVLLFVPAVIAIAMKLPSLMIVGGILMFIAFTAGMVFGVIAFLRNSLAIQVAVEEGLKIRASMRRSKDLSSGAKGRIFVVALIAGALYMVIGVLQAPLLFLVATAARKGGEAIGAQAAIFLVGFLGHTLVSPVALIGLSLVYFDQRVRKEAFDIAVLLGEPRVESFPPVNEFTTTPVEPLRESYGLTESQQETRENEARAADDSVI